MQKELRKRITWPLILIIVILAIDQIIKIWVKLHLSLGDEIDLIGSWCKIHFIENEGMAFGMAFGGDIGKFCLTLFRIIASVIIFWYLLKMIEQNESKISIYSMSLIFAGASGNIFDSLFYGLIFSASTPWNVATAFQGGYAPFFHGKVVDMFYFPLIDTNFPLWMPFVGGEHFSFFNAIFNFADASISIGVIMLIIAMSIKNRKTTKLSKKQD
jgi:Lipoprotein signal peptidase